MAFRSMLNGSNELPRTGRCYLQIFSDQIFIIPKYSDGSKPGLVRYSYTLNISGLRMLQISNNDRNPDGWSKIWTHFLAIRAVQHRNAFGFRKSQFVRILDHFYHPKSIFWTSPVFERLNFGHPLYVTAHPPVPRVCEIILDNVTATNLLLSLLQDMTITIVTSTLSKFLCHWQRVCPFLLFFKFTFLTFFLVLTFFVQHFLNYIKCLKSGCLG